MPHEKVLNFPEYMFSLYILISVSKMAAVSRSYFWIFVIFKSKQLKIL